MSKEKVVVLHIFLLINLHHSHASYKLFVSFSYLEIADNDIDSALSEAKADIEWEKSQV